MQKSLFENIPMSDVRQPALQQCTVSRSTFYQGDCLIEMDKIADKSIDMIFCDLPYGTTNCHWDKVINLCDLWKQWYRVCKDNAAIVLTGQQPFVTDIINSNRKDFRYEIIWQKTQKLGFLNAQKMPLREHENILVFYRKLPTYNPQKTIADNLKASRKKIHKVSGVYSSHTKQTDWIETGERFPGSILKISNWNKGGFTKNATIHPTQKPVELVEWFIRTFTNEGECVLDNCMGSGTTGIACKKTGRHFIGIEKDEMIFERGVKRVSEYCG